MIQYLSVCPPHRWVQVDRRGTVIDRGVSDTLSAVTLPRRRGTLVAVVPGEAVVTRKVDIPSRNRRKVLAAIPYVLEDTVSADVETLHFALLDWRPTGEATVAVVARHQLDAWLRELREADIHVEHMVPDYLLLPMHSQARCTVATTKSNRVCVRAEHMLGMAFPSSAVEFWWDELEDKAISIAVNDADLAQRLIKLDGTMISEWDIGDDFTTWLEHHQRVSVEANLLQGDYATKRHAQTAGGLKAAAVMLALAAAIKLMVDVEQYLSLKRQNATLDIRITETLRSVFPQITRIVNPRVQMEREISVLMSNELGRGEFQYLLAIVARAVPASQVTLEEVTFRDNVLVITISTANFAGVDQLKKRLEEDKTVNAVLVSSGSRDNRVSGRFRLERAI